MAKNRKRQQSRKIVFKPNCDRTFYTLDLALVEFPETKKGDWLIADSIGEYARFNFLLEMQARGEISQLYFHPIFLLLPQTKIPKNALWGAHVQSKIGYEADFSYFYQGVFVAEDFKASYSDSPKNRAKGIAGKAIVEGAARLRHKLLISKLIGQYGANCHFKIVINPLAPLSDE